MNLDYPIRINRYLALQGIASRREADRLIERGQVTINGRKARLGDQVALGDKVEVKQQVAKQIARERVYYVFHKPVGIATEDVAKLIPTRHKIFHIGRLDKNSSGLLILTNDGRITDRLLNPNFAHEKEYVVRVDKRITDSALGRLAKGVNIEGYMTRPAVTERAGENGFRITLTEGKPHQIRRMCAALGYVVRELKRVRVMNITLGKLRPGGYREIKHPDLERFVRSLSITP